MNKEIQENKEKNREENKYVSDIATAVVEMDEDNIIKKIDLALENGVAPEKIYMEGLSDGMLQVTRLFEAKEYFVSEVIVCADTLNLGIKHLRKKVPLNTNKKGPKIVLAVVEGDLHEIGKNIVKIMFEAAGFNVIDMGINAKAKDIVQKGIEENADIITLSTMMTTTMGHMKEVVDLFKEINEEIKKGENLEKYKNNGFLKIPKVIIGGGCISQKYANEIGADGYSSNAVEAVLLVKRLMGIED